MTQREFELPALSLFGATLFSALKAFSNLFLKTWIVTIQTERTFLMPTRPTRKDLKVKLQLMFPHLHTTYAYVEKALSIALKNTVLPQSWMTLKSRHSRVGSSFDCRCFFYLKKILQTHENIEISSFWIMHKFEMEMEQKLWSVVALTVYVASTVHKGLNFFLKKGILLFKNSTWKSLKLSSVVSWRMLKCF